MNLFTKQKQTHRHRKQTYGYQKGKVGYYIKCINNKDLLYSTGNYIQYPMINHNGKYEKEYIYLYVCVGVCVCVCVCVCDCTLGCTTEIDTTL